MDNIENIYSLSPLQQGLLSYTVTNPESRVYQQQLSLRIDGPLDSAAFCAAWRQMMARHSVLRTAILWEDLDDAYQVVLADLPLPLTQLDWRGDADIERALSQLEIAQREQPLDLATPPLMRLCLVRLAEQRWQMIWTHHHIVLDGWSEGIVLSDWLACYRAISTGATPTFAPTRPFQDYIGWLGEQDEAAAAAFWQDHLGHVSEATPLPNFGNATQLTEGDLPCAEQTLVLPANESQRMVEFARAQRVTLNTLVQAAWGLLLGAYAGREEALFGITLSGRPDVMAHSDEMVGLFINTLPLNIRRDTDQPIGDWLRGIQATAAELRQYEHSALSRLRSFSSIPSGQALFEAILVFENFPLDASLTEASQGLRFSASEGGVLSGDVRLTQGRNNFPLSLIAVPSGDAFEFVLSYSRACFGDGQIRLMLGHLKALMAALTESETRPAKHLRWLAENEQRQLLAWGTGEECPTAQLCLHQLFEHYTDKNPEQLALISRSGSLTYAELDARSNKLARHLLESDVHSGDFVAIALERSTDFIVTLLAVLKSGAAYLPLDLKQPPLRLAELLADSNAKLLITHSQWLPQLEQCKTQQVVLDDIQTSIAALSAERVAAAVTPASAAYLIYTSGSTGMPKGVVIEHHAIVDYVTGAVSSLQLPIGSRYGLVSTLAADLGHTQLFGALAGGGTLVLADEDTAFNPKALADYWCEAQVDVLKLTPSHLQGLLTAHPSANLLPNHTLILGGEQLSSELIYKVRALKPALRIVNHYGPSETAVGAVFQVVPDAPGTGRSVALGRPLPNRRLYVLNEAGAVAPIGVPGELYIGGSAIAREYWMRPELSAEKFISDPFAGNDQRMYRTGDRVRWLDDGKLEFIGRVDNQVKIRGFRIELGEVEAQVKKLSPQISQVLARVEQLPDQAPRVVAYVVADSALSTEKLRDDLSLRVPDYLVPSAFVLLDAIPLTANGKPDYNKLPAADTASTAECEYSAPRTATERQLAEIWQAVLKVEKVGIHDNFFSLGGDSILNLQIIARAGQAGLKLTPKQLFEHRTVAQLAAVLRPDQPVDAEGAPQQVKPVPLTAGQRARVDAAPITATWRLVTLAGAPSPETLSRALQAVQQHHRVLQMALSKATDGHWQQTLVTQPKPLTASRLDAGPIVNGPASPNTHEQRATLAELAETCLAKLDIDQAEALHAYVIESGHSQALLFVAHPLAIDESSWPLVLADFGIALEQIQHQRPIALSWTGGDWLDWAEHQQAYAKGDMDETWEHWLQYVGTEPARLEVPQAEATHRAIQLEQQLSEQLSRLQRRSQVTWEALLTTAIAHVADKELSEPNLLLDLQSGRPALSRLPTNASIAAADFDPSRMVGALAHGAPLFLNWDRSASFTAQVLATEAQLAQQPQRGADYAVLRYLSENVYMQEPLCSLPEPQLGLYWLGDWDRQLNDVPLQAIVAASLPAAQTKALQISAYWHKGSLNLDLQGPLAALWQERLLSSLSELAALADGDIRVPAVQAFPLCAIVKDSISLLPLEWDNIEDLYPLSAMQQGMLLHTQLTPESGVYLVQERFRWQGPLDRAALGTAWEMLLARHPILRTGFTWQHSDVPLQYVCREVDARVDWHDWQPTTADEQLRQLDALLDAERRQGFNLRQPPLIRLRVFQVGEQDYLLARSFHHLLSDAWSFNLVMQDLLTLYHAQCQKRPAALPQGRPFSDYIRWLMRQDANAAENFWKAELHGFDEPTPLPKDRREIGDNLGESAEVQLNLSVALTQKLQQRCQHYQLTANTWLQGAWAMLLSRYSGKRDVLFGMTVAGRPSELTQVEGIAGVFINSLPLRVKIDDACPGAAWLAQLFERSVSVRDYEHTPLVQIQRWSGVGAGRPLFESLLIFENAPMETADATRDLGFSIDLMEDRSPTSYPINLMVMPGSRLGLRITYDSGLFNSATIERMLGHLGQLLEDMLERPDAPLGELNLLTPAERQQILIDWNDSAADFPLQQAYATLFAEQVEKHPQRVAAVCGEDSLTYAELDVRANRIAHALVAAGAGPDKLVALLAERGLPLLTMMIAVFKAGAAYQPMDVNHPNQRLAELLELGGATIVLASERSAAQLDQILGQTASQPHCLLAEELWTDGPEGRPQIASSPDDLAYVIFTSGSTGTPKGAMVEQRGMLNNIYGKIPAIGLDEGDRLAQTASPAFDISVWQFLAAPLVGATVYILPDEITQEPAQLLQAVDQQQITLLEVVPSVMRAMLADAQQDCSLASLRWLMSIGEALPPALCRDWFARFAHVPLLNLYGPAECADNIGFHPITEPPGDECQHMPIGRPTANNQLYVLDDALRPVPVGITGEICTAGFGVGRGYLNDPERTQAAFAQHPFQPGARFYRTGDIGRYLPNGVIEYLGRRDQQVKIRGQRIELGEIENRLTSHAHVETAVVLALTDERNDARLVAYWQPAAYCSTGAAGLREHLAASLPAYAVPAAFVQLEKLPLNANGKLDRKALAAMQPDESETQLVEYQAPRTQTETRLAAIWADVLALSQVSVEADFFALGGHSLLATQLISRVRKGFQLELPLSSVFNNPTVAGLAEQIDQAKARQDADMPLTSIKPQPRTGRLPLSFAQQRLWFLEQLAPGRALFNIPFALTLSGELDIQALRQSFDYLIQRHEVLRTAFVSQQGEPRQEIKAIAGFELPLVDLSDQTDAAQKIDISGQLNRLFQSPFDLQQPPMLRALLFKRSEEQHVLAVAFHHIAVDDWSMGLLVDDLMHAYGAYSCGRQPALTPLTLQYADFAVWQRQYLPGPVWDRQLHYWRNQLAGAPTELSLPGRIAEQAGQPQHAMRLRRQLSLPLTQALQSRADATGATLFMVLHAAFNVLLHQQTGRTDLLIGTDVANRHHGETETMVGFFVNQLVLRCHLHADQSFSHLLGTCRAAALEAYQHQDLPFDSLVSELLPHRNASVAPFFQVKLIMQNAPQQDLVLEGLQVDEWELEPQDAEMDLLINCIPSAEGLQVLYNFNCNRYPRSTIEQLAALFEALLERIATAPEQTVGEFAYELSQYHQTLQQQALAVTREVRKEQRASLATARRKSVNSSQ